MRLTAAGSASGCSARHFISWASLLVGRVMQRWVSLIGALVLAVSVLAGGMAHAAERFDCIPTTAEAVGHYDGDGDEWPADGEPGVAHHHSGCSGHQLGTPVDSAGLVTGHSAETVPVAWREAGVPARSPDNLLRPPIA